MKPLYSASLLKKMPTETLQAEIAALAAQAAGLYDELQSRQPQTKAMHTRSMFYKYLDDGVQYVQPTGSSVTFRQNLYRYARRHHFYVRAYMADNGFVVFELATVPVLALPGAPARGTKSHKKVS